MGTNPDADWVVIDPTLSNEDTVWVSIEPSSKHKRLLLKMSNSDALINLNVRPIPTGNTLMEVPPVAYLVCWSDCNYHHPCRAPISTSSTRNDNVGLAALRLNAAFLTAAMPLHRLSFPIGSRC